MDLSFCFSCICYVCYSILLLLLLLLVKGISIHSHFAFRSSKRKFYYHLLPGLSHSPFSLYGVFDLSGYMHACGCFKSARNSTRDLLMWYYICAYIYLIFLFLSIKTIYIGHVSFWYLTNSWLVPGLCRLASGSQHPLGFYQLLQVTWTSSCKT